MKLFSLILVSLLFLISCNSPTGPLEIYRVKQAAPDNKNTVGKECFYCFDATKNKLYDTPLVAETDIASFDWDTQQITLTEAGQKKVYKLHIPKKGLAVAFVLDGEPVYGFWFWDQSSGFGCDRVYTYPKKDFKLIFGVSEAFRYGEDLRFDAKLKRYVKEKKWIE